MTCIISLSPSMQRRLNFEHPLLDQTEEYKKDLVDCQSRDDFILGHMWLVKDLVMRFRAHWPQTRRFTEDLVSVGLETLTKRASSWDAQTLNSLQAAIHEDMRKFINDFRSISAASHSTNARRDADEKPLEYNFAKRLNERLVGCRDDGPAWIEFMDSLQRLKEADQEHMRELVYRFLESEHGIDPETLSDGEIKAIGEFLTIFDRPA